MQHARVLYQNQRIDITDNSDGVWLSPRGVPVNTDVCQWLPTGYGSLIGLAVNSVRHADESQVEIPKNPILYFKLPNSLTGHKCPVLRPDDVAMYTPQAELVVVIGHKAHRIDKTEALNYVAGYTILNNFTAQDYVKGYYRPPVKAKNFDGSGALGPWMTSADQIANPDQLVISTRVNGKTVSEGTTEEYVHSVADAITYISDFMTLQPGTMITMGTVGGLANVKAGDKVQVKIKGIGKLTNTLVTPDEFYTSAR